MPALRRAHAALLTGALTAALALAAAAPASAAAPVTRDDHVSMYPGQFKMIDVLANDSDPDGDALAVCRLSGPTDTEKYVVDLSDGDLVVGLAPGVTGPITITYYACDFETLVPGTLTIDVKKVAPVRVTKLDRPGRLRVTNRNDRPVRFLWGSAEADRADGRTRVPAHGSAVVRVHRHRIIWIAVIGRAAVIAHGRVRGIDLPAGDQPPARATVQLDRAEARAWAAR